LLVFVYVGLGFGFGFGIIFIAQGITTSSQVVKFDHFSK